MVNKRMYQVWNMTDNREESRLYAAPGPAKAYITVLRGQRAWYNRRQAMNNLPTVKPKHYVLRVYELTHIQDEDYERR